MATTAKSPRALAEERSKLQGSQHTTFADAGAGAVRSLELNNIMEGETVTIPSDYKVYKTPITGSTFSAVKVITEEGKDFFIGSLTRSAQPVDGSPRVMPTGTVVEKLTSYASMDEFFKNEMAGKKIKFTKKTVVKAQAFDDPNKTRDVNVWQLDFAK